MWIFCLLHIYPSTAPVFLLQHNFMQEQRRRLRIRLRIGTTRISGTRTSQHGAILHTYHIDGSNHDPCPQLAYSHSGHMRTMPIYDTYIINSRPQHCLYIYASTRTACFVLFRLRFSPNAPRTLYGVRSSLGFCLTRKAKTTYFVLILESCLFACLPLRIHCCRWLVYTRRARPLLIVAYMEGYARSLTFFHLFSFCLHLFLSLFSSWVCIWTCVCVCVCVEWNSGWGEER
ncbi:hypothetical protein K504DRAFT_16967 [Pleomassaria siparia CBS 279.74]|uniref:Uncharacterized protein n=1 Tax=Pleomassaria siparia CBS 279.74 TaxID=1314801 RepID=A0A6G1KRS5_9PLEO|nr:hypothetical protein K504DRAFT_16967 [Pleomassaria siparia CBS 279.74]